MGIVRQTVVEICYVNAMMVIQAFGVKTKLQVTFTLFSAFLAHRKMEGCNEIICVSQGRRHSLSAKFTMINIVLG